MKALSFIAFLLLSMSYSYCMAADSGETGV